MKFFIKLPNKNLLIILFCLGFGEWFVSDVINFSGGSLGFIIICLSGYLFLRNGEAKFNEPKDLKGWIKLCDDDLNFFNELEEKNDIEKKNMFRKNKLHQILNEVKKPKISLITESNQALCNSLMREYFPEDKYELITREKLESNNSKKEFSEDFLGNEAIFYFLSIPLSARDLLWLQKVPKSVPIWIVILNSESNSIEKKLEEFNFQIPDFHLNRILNLDLANKRMRDIPLSLRKFLIYPKRNIENTKKRLLKELHANWQADIEAIRRVKLKDIQIKNQLLVATSVFASPIPSIDVLSMTVLNSLMIKEIKAIWGCNWSPEMLDKVSKQIIKTAIAQGVVEWSSNSILNLTKLHAPNWLIAGSLQAGSAAYLTRVVSRSLADFMAISKGVSEPDLNFIKNNSDMVVKNAFEKEKIDWKSLILNLQNSLKIKYG